MKIITLWLSQHTFFGAWTTSRHLPTGFLLLISIGLHCMWMQREIRIKGGKYYNLFSKAKTKTKNKPVFVGPASLLHWFKLSVGWVKSIRVCFLKLLKRDVGQFTLQLFLLVQSTNKPKPKQTKSLQTIHSCSPMLKFPTLSEADSTPPVLSTSSSSTTSSKNLFFAMLLSSPSSIEKKPSKKFLSLNKSQLPNKANEFEHSKVQIISIETGTTLTKPHRTRSSTIHHIVVIQHYPTNKIWDLG